MKRFLKVIPPTIFSATIILAIVAGAFTVGMVFRDAVREANEETKPPVQYEVEVDEGVGIVQKGKAVQLFVSGQVNLLRFCDAEQNRWVYVAWAPRPRSSNAVAIAVQPRSEIGDGC